MPSAAANSMKLNPRIPKVSPTAVPPPPCRAKIAYGTYTASAAPRIQQLAISHGRWVRSIRMSRLFLRLQQVGEECLRLHAMRRVVRTRIHATRFRQIVAQIAGGRLAPRGGVSPRLVHKFLHIDVAVRTVRGAQPAAHAPVLNHHFQRISPP